MARCPSSGFSACWLVQWLPQLNMVQHHMHTKCPTPSEVGPYFSDDPPCMTKQIHTNVVITTLLVKHTRCTMKTDCNVESHANVIPYMIPGSITVNSVVQKVVFAIKSGSL